MLRELGGSAVAKKEARKNKMRALGVAGERWSVEAALRRVVAYAVRATATRSRRRGHAARGLYRWSATEWHHQLIQSRAY